MANIINRYRFHRILLSTVLSTFTITYTIPLPAIQFPNQINIGQATNVVRIEKAVERLLKTEKKSIDKMLDALVEVKNEIETSYNTKFNIDYYFDQVEKEIKKSGNKISKKELNSIKSRFKKKDKQAHNHVKYLAETMYLDGYQLNEFDEELMFASKNDKDENKENDDEVVVPALLVYGVTVALCGMFLMFIPIPACKDWGGRMVVAGVTACANSLCNRADENNKNKKN